MIAIEKGEQLVFCGFCATLGPMTTLNLALSPAEKNLLVDFLEQLSDRFGNDGCNDFYLPNDEKHRELMRTVIKSQFSPEAQEEELAWLERQAKNGKKLVTMNITVLGYLIDLVKAVQPTHAI